LVALAESMKSLNPLKRVNSILTKVLLEEKKNEHHKSQSPQAGQFNSYLTELRRSQVRSQVSIPSSGSIQFLQTATELVALAESVSIPSSGSIQFLRYCSVGFGVHGLESQSPQAGQFNSYVELSLLPELTELRKVSIPSSGSIQFLRN